MSPEETQATWTKILEVLDDKLQCGFLEQARSVVEVKIESGTLQLACATDEAVEFFNSDVNQQRLMLLSRSVISLSEVKATKTDAPLPE